MLEFADIILQRRRFVIAGTVLVIDLLLMSLLAPTLQAHQADITARISASPASQPPPSMYDGPNVVTNVFSQVAGDSGWAADAVEVKILGGTMSTATGIVSFDKGLGQVSRAAVVFPLRVTGAGVGFTAHVIAGSFAFTGHVIGGGFGLTGRGAGDVFASAGHGLGDTFGFVGGITHVSSIVRPADHTTLPTIKQLRLQQAALIQSGTMGVSLTSVTSGVGGACDAGDGNGGYPFAWCDAPMDSIATVSYTNDPINRECTSYAYWYFTSVEGHTNFQATGNAKYWASTSNYATRTAPADGAIAVETAGAYGHVAIVQALPGQKYDGETVPAGYVLVSEMNYDWNGHFRYSFAPLGKFSAYIYP